MAGSKVATNSKTKIFMKLDDDPVADISAGADDAAKWAAVETWCAGATEIKQAIDDFPAMDGTPTVNTSHYYGSDEGVAEQGAPDAEPLVFTVKNYNRSNAFMASLEDLNGEAGHQPGIVTVTRSDKKSVADTTNATARGYNMNFIGAIVPNGSADENQSLEVTIGSAGGTEGETKTGAIDQA